MKQDQQQMKVKILSQVWHQDNHGLFDYEAKDLQFSTSILDKNTSIYLKNNNLSFEQDQNEEDIGRISFEEGNCYFISNPKKGDAFLKLQQQQEYQLKAGDLLKLGRMEYFVSEIYCEENFVQMAPDHFNIYKHIQQEQNGKHMQCKFCLMEETEGMDNPFFSQLCKCQGHIQFVHYKCLKEWINFSNRIRTQMTHNTVYYEWDHALECEVCKEPIPSRVYLNQNPEPYHLINVERLPLPYIIVEQITRQAIISKSVTLIHSANQCPINVGRGHNCELKCQDISVSRTHASINYENKWTIKDLGSKFGTLQLIRDKLQLNEQIQDIQIGRILLKIQLIQQQQNNYDF